MDFNMMIQPYRTELYPWTLIFDNKEFKEKYPLLKWGKVPR